MTEVPSSRSRQVNGAHNNSMWFARKSSSNAKHAL
eukprot:CAMPEP_0176132826 /NCGR_PEP_ID=MMETSP0120_2-20121206/67303_1 /TAXON_ID=160619 /ORGANISM="Kryptoperidinium foliaceum, Strain CCMP 1326" /LENGTH=34 /DNA_ID= /DNA_START= /DNA_END= /DNA_ORIENTATION=